MLRSRVLELRTFILGLGAVLLVAVWLFWEPVAVDLANWALEKVGLAGRRDRLSGLRANLGTVKTSFVADPSQGYAVGTVGIKGELWRARCRVVEAGLLVVGDQVAVESRDGLTIRVRSVSRGERP